MEDQELLECPYDKSHRILKHRMQIHLRKCGRNHVHPKEDLVTCPFNVTHVVPKVELEVSSCMYVHTYIFIYGSIFVCKNKFNIELEILLFI